MKKNRSKPASKQLSPSNFIAIASATVTMIKIKRLFSDLKL